MRLITAFVCVVVILSGCTFSHDGQPLWQFETKKKHKQWAAVDAQRLYLCADDVYCLDIASGRLLWEFGTFGTHSSEPVIVGERLFFQCGGLYALDAATGAVLWEFWTKTWATVSPVADTGRVYAPVGEQLFCLDAATGKSLWTVQTGSLKTAPVLIGNRLFFNIGETIFCLDASSGKELWRLDVGSDWVQLAPGGDYLLSACSRGLVRAHRIENGESIWEFNADNSFMSLCPLSAGQIIIAAGTLYCLKLESGVPMWTFKDKALVFKAQVLGDSVFARSSERGVVCVIKQDGKFVRSLHLPDGGRLLTDTNGAVFFSGGKTRHITCLSLPSL